MFKALKKLWIACFTNKPYRVKKYAQLTKRPVGEHIDIVENHNQILYTETGSIISYPELSVKDGQIIERYVGGKKRYFINKGVLKEPDRVLFSLSNSCIIGQLGVVYIPEKRAYVAESAKEWFVDIKKSPFTNIVNFSPKTSLRGITLSCLTNGADAGFYHFIFEAIVKVKFAQPVINQVDHLLFNGPCNEWKMNWLTQAGIDTKKVIWVDNDGHYECDQLLFTNRLIADQQISNWCVNALRTLTQISFNQPLNKTKPRVLLISRSDFIRSIKWENDILEKYPFIERIHFSKITPDEAINAMAGATHIIGPHGAALGNIVFCEPGTKVLEIYPHGKTYQPCYYRAASICNLVYSVLYLNFDNPDDGLSDLMQKMEEFLN